MEPTPASATGLVRDLDFVAGAQINVMRDAGGDAAGPVGGNVEFDGAEDVHRYSPGQVIGTKKQAVSGKPDAKLICTSHIERSNLTMRMQMRRFTRLTNAFSKKFENHKLACDLHFVHYNFCRIHQTLRTTPAMAAGLTSRVWEVSDLVGLLDGKEAAYDLAA